MKTLIIILWLMPVFSFGQKKAIKKEKPPVVYYGDSYNSIYDKNGKFVGIQMNGMAIPKGFYIINKPPAKRKKRNRR